MASLKLPAEKKKEAKMANSFQRRKIRFLEEKGYELESYSDGIAVMTNGEKRKMILPNGKKKKLY